MSRTTVTNVRAILGEQYDGTADLQPFIDTAAVLVDQAVAADSDSLLGTSTQERIECYLAAHFYEHADQMMSSKSTGGASGQFQGQTQMVLTGTKYGQTACLLDCTGYLEKRSKEVQEGGRRRVGLYYIGSHHHHHDDS